MTSPVPLTLVVDAGHTRIKFALCRAADTEQLPKVLQFLAPMCGAEIPWATLLSWPELLAWPELSIGKPPVLITGSNPVAIQTVIDQWPEQLGAPRWLIDRTTLPIHIQVDEPARVGIDRLLTAIAANHLRRPNQTAIIVDTGTAVTVDAVGSTGVFLGGAILPGVRMGSQALHRYTSTLPEIDASTLFGSTPMALGSNTTAAIESGLYWGHVGAVRELILRQRDRVASFDKVKDAPSLIVMTGGASPLLQPHFGNASFEPYLALQGLAIVAAAQTATGK